MNYLEVRKAARLDELPVSMHTAYKWHSLKKYPALVFKIAGKLFFDMDEWENMANQSKARQAEEAQRIRKGVFV
jgi:hypothetical protein